ncbi:MAG TPA: putative Ig domain-containing protein [Candidatus Limnocylindria bacterium]|nr:putative Ig domain-containing protein [Candidatus Limnocylindria bacterium]
MKPILAIYVALVVTVAAVGITVGGKTPKPEVPACDPVVTAPRHGQAAIDELGASITNVAAKNRRGEDRLKSQLKNDETLWVDPCGQLFYAETDELPVDPPQAAATLVFPASQTFQLHSRPGASRVLYIDFNGELITGTAWNANYNGGADIVAPAFDIDSAPSTFSDNELAIAQSVWLRVAEDYAPFDVDITTADPGLAAIDRSGSGDLSFGTRVLVTNDNVIYNACLCAGIAYVGSFDMSGSHQYYQPAFALQRGTGANAKVIGEVVSHEAGHTLGLSHDGNASTAYYTGQGSWAPIMGTSYNRPITQWSKGEYSGANNTEDDLAIMQQRGATLRSDDVPSQMSAAMPLQSGVLFNGFIGTAADSDWFSTAGSGQINVVANVASLSPNLDLRVQVYDDAGNLLAGADPAASTITGDSATGLSVNVTANLPTSGTYYVKVEGVGFGDALTDGYSDYGSIGAYALTVTVLDPSNAPQITTTSLPTASSFSNYSTQLTATSGVAPYNWGLDASSAALPAALSMAANSGVISGTPTAAAGNYPLTFKVVDANGNSSTRALTLTIADAPLVVTNTIPLPPASLTQPYSLQFNASGGRGSYVWSLASGTIPAGLTLNSAGLMSGTPTRATTYSFTVKVVSGTASSTKSFSMTTANALNVTTTTLAAGTVGTAYSATLAASGGTTPYVWDIASGNLPAGLSLVAGKITGTPTQRESQTLTFRATDTAGRVKVSNPLTLAVYQVSINNDPALPAATRGQPYSVTLAADGGVAPYKWSLASGALPTGVTLSTTGVISGTTQVPGTFAISVKATDASLRTAVKAMTLVVNLDPAVPYITNTSLPAGSLTQPYSVQLNAVSGPGDYTWSLASGTLPAGLALSAGGLISGTPTTATTYSFTVRVTSGTATDTKAYSVPVAAAVVVSTTSLTAATVGSAYSVLLAATGGTRSYTWAIESGALPAGLTLAAGKISGTPTARGSETIVFRVTDTAGRVALSNPLTLNVYQVSITTAAALPAATTGQAYSLQLVAEGGLAPYTWARSSGSLPSGLTLSTAGLISGTPTVTGTFTYTVKVTDAGSRVVTKTLTLSVNAPAPTPTP